MLLTFTNKASREMIARLESHFSKDILEKIHAGTFHAIAYRYLAKHRAVSIKQPRELKMLLRSIYNNRRFDALGEMGEVAPYKADYLYDVFSLCVNSFGGTIGEFITRKNAAQGIYAEIYDDIFSEFMEMKRAHNYVSYDDLLLRYREEMLARPAVFTEILVDEYQDTNLLQNSIITALNAQSLFCVGDYDQSIYAFNGADIGIIASFKDNFKNANVLTLSKNYRSSEKILRLANAVIAHNPRIYPKSLEVLRDVKDSKVEVMRFESTREQYLAIAKHIAESSTPREKIAILFRNNITGDNMEAVLRECAISARKRGARSFFESREIAILIDILHIFFNQKDMVACVNILSLGSGIGENIARDIYEALMTLGDGSIKNGFLSPKDSANPYKPRARNPQLGLFDDMFIQEDKGRFDEILHSRFASHIILSHPKITPQSAVFLERFYELLQGERRNLGELFRHIVGSEFFRDIARSLATNRVKAKYKYVDEANLRNELDNINRKVEILGNLAKSYDDLGKFLNSITLNSAESSNGEGVHLLTIHASKGLEFDNVYVIDLMEGRFPNTALMSKTGSLEEERRLFYVATTRARNNLYLSFATRDSTRSGEFEPSIFLKEANLL